MCSKTIIFGLDGACFGLIQPWIESGQLDTINQLTKSGGSTPLESCVPATTPPAWTSLTTGVNPGKHGVFGFYARTPETYDIEPVSDSRVYARRLWDYTSEFGLTALVINVPVTHPAREIDGALVPGYLSPNSPATYPSNILSDVGMDNYQVYAESETDDVPDEQLLTEWLSLTRSRGELARRLMDKYDWDLLFVEFQKTDGAVHKFEGREKVRQIYECVDECMGSILSAVNGTPNVFVVSDHGIGQQKDWSIALNTWLAEGGYLKTTTEIEDSETWLEQATNRATEGANNGSRKRDLITAVVDRVDAAGVTKQQVERILSKLGLYDIAVQMAPSGIGDALETESVNRERSIAFYEGMGFSGVDVGVVINSERYYAEQGQVSDTEYEQVRGDLIRQLQELEGPEGPPFSRVRTRGEVYHGPNVRHAPDIILEQSERYVIGSQYPRGQAFSPTDPGRIDHTRDGLMIAAGPDIADTWSVDETPSIFDITPTLLGMLGVPLNTRFDGTVIEELLVGDGTYEEREYEPVERQGDTQLTDGERERLHDRLRGMGYLE